MEKRKKWQFLLILTVIFLTVYNILPTVFYYSKPLKSSIDSKKAQSITKDIALRVNELETNSKKWLYSFSKLIDVSPENIKLDKKNPEYFLVSFTKLEDAKRFRQLLPRAGALIPFSPEQLSVAQMNEPGKQVRVQRKIPVHFDQSELNNYFQFAQKTNEDGTISSLYRELITDRFSQVLSSIAGTSENARNLSALQHSQTELNHEISYPMASNIVRFVHVFGEKSPITHRYFSSFTQGNFSNRSQAISSLVNTFSKTRDSIRAQKMQLEKEKKLAIENKQLFNEVRQQQLRSLERKEDTLLTAEAILKKHAKNFAKGQNPLTYTSVYNECIKNSRPDSLTMFIGDRNPFIDQAHIDWNQEQIILQLHPDVIAFRKSLEDRNASTYEKDQFHQLLVNEIARIHRQTDEELSAFSDQYTINLNDLTNSESFLVLNLPKIGEKQVQHVKNLIENNWVPSNPELSKKHFHIYDAKTFNTLPKDQQSLCLVIYGPGTIPDSDLRQHSLYVVAKGVDKILQRYQVHSDSEEAQSFLEDFSQLRSLLQQNGFFGFHGKGIAHNPTWKSDFIFEKDDYYTPLLAATREDFRVHGSKKYASLEFTNVEQRLLVTNRIETRMQEDLVKWRDDFLSAQVDINKGKNLEIPNPTKNVFFNNLALSTAKYFRGDDRKVIHWGLDLSGGKTVQIELRDSNNRIVTAETDIKQGINELYNRVNKMGVSEVNIRQEGTNIVLDFPGSQGLSASELVKASSMYFHIVNEKFSSLSPNLSQTVNRFLQEVWNEAVVTNRKDPVSINSIAHKHLYGDIENTNIVEPRSESARVLYDNGLRLASPRDSFASNTFDDTLSKIAVLRGSDYTEWHGQSHPLLFVFNNYALEGSNLDNVRSSYDPSKGNYLSFEVKGSYTAKNGDKLTPSADLHTWTSEFSKEKILGTQNESYTQGRGWRMAVILNGSVISAPALESALKDSAMITGNFSQREVNKLVADLKAGSLTYTPRILSEKNVSPELGIQDRTQGILATALALVLVIGGMIGYYRFAGVVASVAVLFNLLIMWATLQNLQATLTLAGIAGVILTVGMAVDANVLVFERIREEFERTKKIASAIQIGYKKAFSAIFDSNITTILAALILLNFDAGPIKAFAVMIIIGIASSMFTALFMTRFFFAGWVTNKRNKSLTMMNLVKASKFNFLGKSKIAFSIALAIILLGSYSLMNQRHSIFGMDFTGGYSLTVKLPSHPDAHYRLELENALKEAGATPQNFQVRQLTPENHLKILFGPGMEQESHPFYNMPLVKESPTAVYSYQNNPRIDWFVDALEKANIQLSDHSLETIDDNWSAISGQMSDTMRDNALMGLGLAFVCILIYLTFRFEFKYAISALLCLFHDVLIALSAIAILHWLKVPTQIDMHAIAALMTIIGYSLNDTIIVFDRIREDLKTQKRMSFPEIINHSLNVTLSRTTITSATTLLVLTALVLFGGASIFSFALIMAIGVIIGTFSSLFIASPIMLAIHNYEQKRETSQIAANRR